MSRTRNARFGDVSLPLKFRALVTYQLEMTTASVIDKAVNHGSMKFLQSVWHTTNIPHSHLLKLKKSSNFSSVGRSSANYGKKKSILISSVNTNGPTSKYNHVFTVSQLIRKFQAIKNKAAIG